MTWSPNTDWLVTADNNGIIKYWQANMNNLKAFVGHKDPIRGISYVRHPRNAPPHVPFVTQHHRRVCARGMLCISQKVLAVQRQVCIVLGRRGHQGVGLWLHLGGNGAERSVGAAPHPPAPHPPAPHPPARAPPSSPRPARPRPTRPRPA